MMMMMLMMMMMMSCCREMPIVDRRRICLEQLDCSTLNL